jgi:hypothetical protein
MNKIHIRAILITFTIVSAGLGRAIDTFIRQYENPNEEITNVRTIKQQDYFHSFLALEGRNLITNTFFTRLQPIDYLGQLPDYIPDAYIGKPLTLSSGIFEVTNSGAILTPAIELNEANHLALRWYHSSAMTEDNYSTEVILPDSIYSIVEFPTVMSKPYENAYLMGGRGNINGVTTCFFISSDPDVVHWSIIAVPGLAHISGITKVPEGYLVIGQGGTWKGRALLISETGSLIWQQEFTDGDDSSTSPLFATPLVATQSDGSVNAVIISYQKKDRTLHLARYQSQSLADIYTLQLDSYIAAIPIVVTDSLIGFGYVKDGQQYLSQITLSGVVNWTTELPGTGNFGRDCLNYTDYVVDEQNKFRYYLVGTRLKSDKYYFAKLDFANGTSDYDEVHHPAFKVICYPNPAGHYLHVYLQLDKPGKLKINIYNIRGQKVSRVINKDLDKGIYDQFIPFYDELKLAAGIYLISTELNGEVITKKVTILN